MKELSIEEKAKAYDKALEKAKAYHNDYTNDIMEEIFPELKESDDERIRKGLLKMFNHYVRNNIELNEYDLDKDMVLAWLEKQGKHANFLSKIKVGDKVTRNEDGVLVNLSQLNRVAKPINKVEPKFKIGDTIRHKGNHIENTIISIDDKKYHFPLGGWVEIKYQDEWELIEQKPAEWSEEDDKRFSVVIAEFAKCAGKSVSKDEWMRCNDWLNSLKDRVQLQPVQEWSDEDNEHIKSIISTIECSKAQFPNSPAVLEAYNSDLIWLKSLKERYTWKPSEEQMKALWDSIPEDVKEISEREMLLNELYKDLKKL